MGERTDHLKERNVGARSHLRSAGASASLLVRAQVEASLSFHLSSERSRISRWRTPQSCAIWVYLTE